MATEVGVTSPDATGLVCTVVIPVHDDAAGALRCLEALRRQDLPAGSFEVIFCDNASSRAPLMTADVARVGGPAVQVLTTPEPGSYRARNGGLLVARAPVIAFTDADCLPEPSWLRAGLARLDDAASDICAGHVAVTTSAEPSAVELWEQRNAFPQEKYVRTMNFGVTANLFVRRELFDRLGPFAEGLKSGGDREFCQRAVRGGAALSFAPDAVVRHPARSTAREVALKTRRVLEGARDMGEPPPSLASWLRAARPPLGAVSRSRGLGLLRHRVRYVLGELQAHYIRWWLTWRVARD